MFASLYQNPGLLILLALPVIAGQVLALLFIPSMLKSGAQVASVGRAVYCYVAQGLGIVLMGIAAAPTLYGVLAQQSFPNATYTALLFVFAFGGTTFLWHDYLASSIDPLSRQVPFLIHFYTWKMMGLLLLLFASLSLLLQLVFLQAGFTAATNWEMHLVLILFGGLITWCTALPKAVHHIQVHAEREKALAKKKTKR